jgi:hypothetical protein
MALKYFLIVVDTKTQDESKFEFKDKHSLLREAREWISLGYEVYSDITPHMFESV